MEVGSLFASSGMMIYLGLLGLTLMEYSSTRPKHSRALLLKNMLQFSISIICLWLLGFGFIFGRNNNHFIGENLFGGDDWNKYDFSTGFKFHYVSILGTFVVFIINGSISGKTQYGAYIILTICINLFIWPAVMSWKITGWLITEMPEWMIDLGSASVFTFAGAFAVAGAVITGRRPHMINSKKNITRLNRLDIYALGSILTILGCLGVAFLYESTGIITANIWICGATSSIVSLKVLTVYSNDLDRHYIAIYQGFIAGMVFITSSSSNTEVWLAALHGLMSGVVFAAGVFVFNWLKVDDVMYVGPTFLFPGIFGGILPGFIDSDAGVYWGGWESGQKLGTQVTGTAVIFFWGVFWGIAVFGALRLLDWLHLPYVLIKKGTKNRAILTQKGFEVVKRHKRKSKKHMPTNAESQVTARNFKDSENEVS